MQVNLANFNEIHRPIYVLEEERLRHNLSLIKSVAERADMEIILAFKAYALWKTFPIFREYISSTTASSLSEAKLPMVGRKTAACVRSYAMDIPSVCVDTHVHRIANLMGLVHTKDPTETEFELMRITPKDRWNDINRYIVRHGQVVCLPNKHNCSKCSVRSMCDSCTIPY